MSGERVQKLLAQAGLASRRAAEELIRAGRVTINGEVAALGDKADPATDAVKVDGRRVALAAPAAYLLLNKPRGYITTRSDPEGRPTVYELLPERWRRRVAPVGRLDVQTEGLLLLTNDGDLAQRVSHPRHGCAKLYRVKVKGHPREEDLARLRSGIVLDGRRTAPARIERAAVRGQAANAWLTVELHEGRTRQLREMFFRIGHPVLKLRRIAIGPLSDRRLAVGKFRELSAREVEALRSGRRLRRPRRRG
ncbi:MAG: pseudouridine synthase [Thermoanaerobaculia bacterium]